MRRPPPERPGRGAGCPGARRGGGAGARPPIHSAPMSAPPDVPAPGDRRSFWLEEALAEDPGEPCPPLHANLQADTCIVGGGFAGLWTAHELTERAPDMRIALLEADICGG